MQGASINALGLVYALVFFTFVKLAHFACGLNIGASVLQSRLYGTMVQSDWFESRVEFLTVFIIRTISRIADSTLFKSFPSCAFSRKIRLQTKSRNSS